jgi:signal peptidase I
MSTGFSAPSVPSPSVAASDRVDRQQSNDARRRPLLAAVLTLVVPGLGHVYAGQLMRGVAAFAILSLASLLATYAFLIVPPSPWLLAVVMTLSVAIVIGTAIDAARMARAAPRPYAPKPINRWYVYAGALVVGLGLGGGLQRLRERVLEGYRHPSVSMAETLLVGDWFFVDKRASMRRVLTHGTIVVYESPENADDKIVKRVVGLPGDTLAARADTLIRNGRVVREPYANVRPYTSPVGSVEFRESGTWGPLLVPTDSIFVLGDNRNASKDSRHVGFIPTRNVIGKPRLIYYSYDPKGDWALPFVTAIRWRRLGTKPQ